MSRPSSLGRRSLQVFLATICLGIAVFWIWALFFPPTKQSVAKVDDVAWTIRANEICNQANLERDKLVDLRRIDTVSGDALAERADIIDKATVIVQKMLDDVTAQVPTGVKDADLMNTWKDMYQDWIDGRVEYTAILRTGVNAPFAESMLEGGPVSDYINDFAVANRMNSCSSPMDLAV
jgi:hypothetical protein